MQLKALCGISAHIRRKRPLPYTLTEGQTTTRTQILRVMKLTAFFLLVASLQISAKGLTQNVSLHEKNVPLKKVFTEIRRQTGYSFFVNEAILDKASRVTIEMENVSLEKALNTVLKDQTLAYSIVGKTIVVKNRTSLPATNTATSILESNIETFPPIHGRVTDTTGKPISNVTVMVKGTKNITVTDEHGNYTFANVDPANVVLVFSFVGYETQEVALKGRTEVNVVLKEKFQELEDLGVVVNTGYQIFNKIKSSGSFENIDMALFQQQTSTSFVNRLDGLTPGLYFNKKVQDNNTDLKGITLNGLTSVYNKVYPLVIVDNFPYQGDINNINPNDIASITILKDAAASAIWGAQAGNGVIVITTKKGQDNMRPVWDFNVNTTRTSKPDLYRYPQMSSKDFIEVEKWLFEQGFYNSLLNNKRTWPVISPAVELLARQRDGLLSSDELNQEINVLSSKDVRDDMLRYLYRSEVNQQYFASVNSGNAKQRFRMSGGYDKTLNNLVGNKSDRISIRSEYSLSINERMQMKAALYWINSNTVNNSPGGYNNISIGGGKSVNVYPYATLVDEKGSWVPYPKTYRQSYLDTVGGGLLQDWSYYPVEEIKNMNRSSNAQDITGNIGFNYSILPMLKANIYYQVEKVSSSATNYYSPSSYYASNLINSYSSIKNGQVSYVIPKDGIGQFADNRSISHDGRVELSVVNHLGAKGNIQALGGFELLSTNAHSQSYTYYGYSPDINAYASLNYNQRYPQYVSGSTAYIPYGGGLARTKYNFLSYYFNGQYQFDSRYFLSGSFRKDQSNVFGVRSNQKGLPLWSVGSSWILSQEHFFHAKDIDLLKFRMSFGFGGNVDNSLSALMNIAYRGNDYQTGNTTAVISAPANPSLQWERTRTINGGVDFSIFGNLLSGSIDYYLKRSDNVIGDFYPDYTVWNGLIKKNGAILQSKSLNVHIKADIHNNGMRWMPELIFSTNTNRVLSYKYVNNYGSAYVGNGNVVIPIEGNDPYMIYSYKWQGLDSNTGDPIGNYDGKESKDYYSISSLTLTDDLAKSGTSVPRYYGNLIQSFEWKHFTISMNISYRFAYFFRRSTISYSSLFNLWNGHTDYEKRWQKSGDEKYTTIPSMTYPVNSYRDAFYASSEPTIEKADNIRMKNISLSYLFLRNGKLFKELSVYGFIDNPMILWKATHDKMDPDYGYIPLRTSISFGIKTTL